MYQAHGLLLKRQEQLLTNPKISEAMFLPLLEETGIEPVSPQQFFHSDTLSA